MPDALEDFAARIGLTGEEIETILMVQSVRADEYAALKALFYRDWEACLAQIDRSDPTGALLLFFCTRLAHELRGAYRVREIPDSVYRDTFSDIALWARTHRERTGACGLSAGIWLSYHLNLRLFRLGRLQFQTDALTRELRLDGRVYPSGTPCLQVHVPAGSPLLPDECEQSYRRALAFFRGIEPLFLCHSWLLSPALDGLLPPASNILRFAGRYTILACFPGDRSAEERVFGAVSDNPEAYPETTHLQREMKRRLLLGRRIPAALGAFALERDTVSAPGLSPEVRLLRTEGGR